MGVTTVGATKKTTKSKRPSTGKKAATPKAASTAKKKSTTAKTGGAKASVDRRTGQDRRRLPDRRIKNQTVATERRKVQRRAKVNRRRQIDPTTCERDYTADEIEFMSALDDYKRLSGRMFPTCSEVLEVIRKLGYEKRPKSETADQPAPEPAASAG